MAIVTNKNPFGNLEDGVILKVEGAESEGEATSAVDAYLEEQGREDLGWYTSVDSEDGAYYIKLAE